MALISSNGLPPACTVCIDFSILYIYIFFSLSMPFVYSLLVHSFYSTYTTGTGDRYKTTYLASDSDHRATSKSLRR
jgi:hypothetical protein